MHLKLNVRWHRNGAVALNACRRSDSGHDSLSLTPSVMRSFFDLDSPMMLLLLACAGNCVSNASCVVVSTGTVEDGRAMGLRSPVLCAHGKRPQEEERRMHSGVEALNGGDPSGDRRTERRPFKPSIRG